MTQFVHWLTCQFCGRAAPKDQAVGWLNDPHRFNTEVNVVRCPQHWSEWALRNTRTGRTKGQRAQAVKSRKMKVPTIPVAIEPFPITDKEK